MATRVARRGLGVCLPLDKHDALCELVGRDVYLCDDFISFAYSGPFAVYGVIWADSELVVAPEDMDSILLVTPSDAESTREKVYARVCETFREYALDETIQKMIETSPAGELIACLESEM